MLVGTVFLRQWIDQEMKSSLESQDDDEQIKIDGLIKRRILLEDGRYMIFFNPAPEDQGPQDSLDDPRKTGTTSHVRTSI